MLDNLRRRNGRESERHAALQNHEPIIKTCQDMLSFTEKET